MQLAGRSAGVCGAPGQGLAVRRRSRLDARGLAEPVLESCRAEERAVLRKQGALARRDAEVARLWVGDDLAGIVARFEDTTNEFIEPELLRSRDFDRVIERRAHCDPSDRTRDVICGHPLDERRPEPNRLCLCGGCGDPLDQLDETCPADEQGSGRGVLYSRV